MRLDLIKSFLIESSAEKIFKGLTSLEVFTGKCVYVLLEFSNT
jgi:hypothetical protein